jgi:hypothetical protein
MNRHENCEYSNETLVRNDVGVEARHRVPDESSRAGRATPCPNQSHEVPMSQGKKRTGGLSRVTKPVRDAAGGVAKAVKRSGRAATRKAGGVLRSIGGAVAGGAEAVTEAGSKAFQTVKESLSPTESKSRTRPKVKAKAKSASSSKGGAAAPKAKTGSKSKAAPAKAKSTASPSASAGKSTTKGSGPKKSR